MVRISRIYKQNRFKTPGTNRIEKKFNSSYIKATSAVPQESYFRPSLFLLQINDIVFAVKYSLCLLFADDFKFFENVKNDLNFYQLLCDINSVEDWCECNRAEMN